MRSAGSTTRAIPFSVSSRGSVVRCLDHVLRQDVGEGRAAAPAYDEDRRAFPREPAEDGNLRGRRITVDEPDRNGGGERVTVDADGPRITVKGKGRGKLGSARARHGDPGGLGLERARLAHQPDDLADADSGRH